MRTTPAGTPASTARGQHRLAAALPHLDLRALGDAELLQRQRVHPRPRRLRVGGLLQRRRAAHQRVGEMDRHVGDALEAGRVASPASRSRPACRCASRAAMSAAAGSSARTSSIDSKSKPGRPSSEPSTRSTFHAGRVSPSGFDDAVEALHAALAVDERAGGLGERADRQQHVGVRRAVPERRQHDDELGLLERSARRDRVRAIELRLGAEHEVGLARVGEHRPRVRGRPICGSAPAT